MVSQAERGGESATARMEGKVSFTKGGGIGRAGTEKIKQNEITYCRNHRRDVDN